MADIYKNKSNIFFKNLPLYISVFFWVIISIFMINFVNRLFLSTKDEIIERERLLVLFLIILSLSLIIVIIAYLVKNVISVIRKEFGARMKLKIILFFIFIALLPIIPFIQIGTKFIESTMNMWFSRNLGSALDLSEKVIKTYYDEKKDLLSDFVDELNRKLVSSKTSYSDLNNVLNGFIKENKIFNISLWNEKGQIIRQLGGNIFDVEPTYDRNFFIQGQITLENNRQGIFNIQKNDSQTFLIIPSKMIDNKGQLAGFLNIAINIDPQFMQVTSEIDRALGTYNTASLYKDFFITGFIILFLTVVFPIILMIFIISLFLTKDLLEPIASLSLATKRVAEGDYNFKIDSTFNDEFMVLSRSFNSMLGELEISREKLQQKEKIATWQEIARQLAHEIRNPLTPIKLSAERILKRYDASAENFEEILNKGIKTIINEVDNMDRLLNEFSSFSRLPDIDKEKGGIVEIIREVVDLFSVNKKNININLVPIKKDYTVLRDRSQLKSVFSNIIKNSIESMREGGSIQVFLDDKEVGFKKYLVITFKDQGRGIDSENDGDVFVPYFSTKEDGRGLGLAITQRIIYEHEGRIYYVSKKDTGTSFFIELPIID